MGKMKTVDEEVEVGWVGRKIRNTKSIKIYNLL